NTEIKNGPTQGIFVNSGVGYDEFLNVKVHDNGTVDLHHGLYLSTNNILIDGSEIYRNSGWGVHVFGNEPSFNVIRNSRIHDNARVATRGPGIGLYGFGNLAYNNVIWGNAGGIEVGGANNAIYNNTITNNSSAGCQCGVGLGTSTATTITNNILYQHSGGGIS